MSKELRSRGETGADARGKRRVQPERQPLSRQRIIETALRVADEEGLHALSMRRLGAELGGYEAMSLYNHLACKAEVLDGLVEVVWSEMRLPSEELDSWDRLRELSRSWRELGHLHPHIFSLLATRLVHAMRPVECALQTFRDAGFDEQSLIPAFLTLVAYVYGSTEREIDRRRARDAANARGVDERSPTLPQPGPVLELTRHLDDLDWDQAFEWGLETTLSGLKSQAPGPGPSARP